MKYSEVRFLNVPYICLIWRNRTKIIIGLEAPLYSYNESNNTYYRNNLLYWEGILSYNYMYKKDIIKTFKNNIWYNFFFLNEIDDDGKNKIKKIYTTLLPALTNTGAEKIMEYYKQLKNNLKKN